MKKKATKLLICGHKFCAECLDSWFSQNNNQKCPICRHDRDDFSHLNDEKDEHKSVHDEKDEKDVHDDSSNNDNNNNNNNNNHDNFYQSDKNTQNQNQNQNNSEFEFINPRNYNFNQNTGGLRYRGPRFQNVGRSIMEDWMIQNELRFRLLRLQRQFPSYLDNNMINRWSDRNYNAGNFAQDNTFQHRAPDYTTSHSSNGRSFSSGSRSGFHFGGGSSRGGGGGGGSW